MAGVTPTTITPTSLPLSQPTQFNPGQDPSKLFGKDFDNHLGNMQGKHKPAPKKAEPKHKPEPKKTEPKKTEAKDHGHDSSKHHKHQPQHTHQPATGQ